jgi:hypothetical protein
MFTAIVVCARKSVDNYTNMKENECFKCIFQSYDGTVEKAAIRLAIVNAVLFVILILYCGIRFWDTVGYNAFGVRKLFIFTN